MNKSTLFKNSKFNMINTLSIKTLHLYIFNYQLKILKLITPTLPPPFPFPPLHLAFHPLHSLFLIFLLTLPFNLFLIANQPSLKCISLHSNQKILCPILKQLNINSNPLNCCLSSNHTYLFASANKFTSTAISQTAD